MASVLLSAVSDSNGCRSRRGAAETRVVVPGVLSTNGERINEWAAADSFIRFGFVDRDATAGAAVPARGRAVRMSRVVRARAAIGGRARFGVALMRLCFIALSPFLRQKRQPWGTQRRSRGWRLIGCGVCFVGLSNHQGRLRTHRPSFVLAMSQEHLPLYDGH